MNDRVAHRIAQLAKSAAFAPTSPQSTAPNDVDRLLSGLPSRRKKHKKKKKRKRESRESLKFNLASKTGAEKLAFQDVFNQPPPPGSQKPPVVLPPGGRGLPADVSNITPAAKPPAGPTPPPAPAAPQGVTPQAQKQHDNTVEKFRYLVDPKATKPGGTPNTANWQLPTPEQFHRQFGQTYEQVAKQMNVPVSMLPHLLYGTNTDQKGFGPQGGLDSSVAYGDHAGDLSRVQNPDQVGRMNFQIQSQLPQNKDNIAFDAQGNPIYPALAQRGRGTNDAFGLQNNPQGLAGMFSANQDDAMHNRHFPGQINPSPFWGGPSMGQPGSQLHLPGTNIPLPLYRGGTQGDPFGRGHTDSQGLRGLYAQEALNAPGMLYNLGATGYNQGARSLSWLRGNGFRAANLRPGTLLPKFNMIPTSNQAVRQTVANVVKGGPKPGSAQAIQKAKDLAQATKQAPGVLKNVMTGQKVLQTANTTRQAANTGKNLNALKNVVSVGKNVSKSSPLALLSPILEGLDAVGLNPEWAGGTGMGNFGWQSSRDNDYELDPSTQGGAGLLPDYPGKGFVVASMNSANRPIRNAWKTPVTAGQALKNWTWDQWSPTLTNPFRSVGGAQEQQRQESIAANPQYSGPQNWANTSYEHTYPGQQSYNTRQRTLDQIVDNYAGKHRDKSGNYGAGNQFRDALLQANPDLMNKMETGELDMSHIPRGSLNIPAGYKNPEYSESGQAFRKKYWSDPSKKYMDPESIRDAEQYEKNVRGASEARAPLQKKYQAHVESERVADYERFNALSPQEKLQELRGRQTARDSVRQLPPKMTSTIRHDDRSKDPSGFKLSLQDNDRDILGQRGSQLQNLNVLRPGEQYAHGDAATEQDELVNQWLQQQLAPQQLQAQAK